MLPSKAIARSLPSRGAWGQLPGERLVSRSRFRALGDGRSFGTALRSSHGGLGAASGSPLRTRHAAMPALVTGLATSRSLSLWGYGKKTTPVDEPTPVPPAPAEETVAPPEPLANNDTPAAAAPPSPAAEPSASDVDFSSISDIVNDADLLNTVSMPETIGYLRAIGLDYGWGPTSVMQWLLEHVHVWTGLGWGGTIVATVFVLRALMMYPQIQGLKVGAISNRMREDPRMKEAMATLRKGFAEKDQALTQRGQAMSKMVKDEHGLSNLAMLWNFVPIPFSFGLFRLLNGMASVPVPSLETAGFLWFPNLTVADPYYMLPFASAGMMSLSMLINSRNLSEQQKKTTKTMMPVMGVLIILCTSWLSAGVNLMGAAFGAATCLTTLITNIPAIRRATGLPPLPNPAPAAPAAPSVATTAKPTYEAPRQPRSLADRMQGGIDQMREGLNSQVSNFTGGGGTSFSASDQDKAERKRRDAIRQLEETRRNQEKEAFERKYKGKQ